MGSICTSKQFTLNLTWNITEQLMLFSQRSILPIPIMDRPRKQKRLFFILMKMVEICYSPHTEARGIPTWSCLATKNSEQWQPTKALYWRAWRGIEVVGLITISSPSSHTSVFLILFLLYLVKLSFYVTFESHSLLKHYHIIMAL